MRAVDLKPLVGKTVYLKVRTYLGDDWFRYLGGKPAPVRVVRVDGYRIHLETLTGFRWWWSLGRILEYEEVKEEGEK